MDTLASLFLPTSLHQSNVLYVGHVHSNGSWDLYMYIQYYRPPHDMASVNMYSTSLLQCTCTANNLHPLFEPPPSNSSASTLGLAPPPYPSPQENLCNRHTWMRTSIYQAPIFLLHKLEGYPGIQCRFSLIHKVGQREFTQLVNSRKGIFKHNIIWSWWKTQWKCF